MKYESFIRGYKKSPAVTSEANWRPQGDSNPCCRDENPVS